MVGEELCDKQRAFKGRRKSQSAAFPHMPEITHIARPHGQPPLPRDIPFERAGSSSYLEKPRRSNTSTSTWSAASSSVSTSHGESSAKLQAVGSSSEDTATGSRGEAMQQKRKEGRKGTGTWRVRIDACVPLRLLVCSSSWTHIATKRRRTSLTRNKYPAIRPCRYDFDSPGKDYVRVDLRE